MTKILGTTLKVNSIDVFPTTNGKENHYLKVGNNSYELVDNETVKQELSTNEDCWSSVTSNAVITSSSISECSKSLRYSINCQPIPSNVFTSIWQSDSNQTYPLEIGSYGDYVKGTYMFHFETYANTTNKVQLQVEDEEGNRYLLEEFEIRNDGFGRSIDTRYYYIDVNFKYWYLQITEGGDKASIGKIGMYKLSDNNFTLSFSNYDINFGNGIKKHFDTLPSVEIIPQKAFYKYTEQTYPQGRYIVKLEANSHIDNPYVKVRSNNEEEWREVFNFNDTVGNVYITYPFEDSFNQIDVQSGYSYTVYKEDDYTSINWYDLLLSLNDDIIFDEESFNVYVNENGETYVSKEPFVRQSNEPSTPVNGLRWIDTAQLPIRSYRYDNTWKRCPDVLLTTISLFDRYKVLNIVKEPKKYNGTHIYNDTYWEYDTEESVEGTSVIVYHNLNIQDTSKWKATVVDSDVKTWIGKNTVGFIAPENGSFKVRLEVLS